VLILFLAYREFSNASEVIQIMSNGRNYTFTIEALGFYEENQYKAVAVNMDIWGYGRTQKEAFDNMVDLAEAQISFAVQSDNMSLIEFPAEDKYLAMYKKARFSQIASKGGTSTISALKDAVAADLPFNNDKPTEAFAFA